MITLYTTNLVLEIREWKNKTKKSEKAKKNMGSQTIIQDVNKTPGCSSLFGRGKKMNGTIITKTFSCKQPFSTVAHTLSFCGVKDYYWNFRCAHCLTVHSYANLNLSVIKKYNYYIYNFIETCFCNYVMIIYGNTNNMNSAVLSFNIGRLVFPSNLAKFSWKVST